LGSSEEVNPDLTSSPVNPEIFELPSLFEGSVTTSSLVDPWPRRWTPLIGLLILSRGGLHSSYTGFRWIALIILGFFTSAEGSLA